MRIWRLHVGFLFALNAMVRWVQSGCAVPACLAACLLRTDRHRKGDKTSLELVMRAACYCAHQHTARGLDCLFYRHLEVPNPGSALGKRRTGKRPVTSFDIRLGGGAALWLNCSHP